VARGAPGGGHRYAPPGLVTPAGDRLLQEHDIIVEIDRYIVWPGQALAYKLGELKIKELRAFASNELGDRFDIRAFHDQVLGRGALPLHMLDANIRAWVAGQKQGD
jgi:uncharacterized protein (DUF885 family)